MSTWWPPAPMFPVYDWLRTADEEREDRAAWIDGLRRRWQLVTVENGQPGVIAAQVSDLLTPR